MDIIDEASGKLGGDSQGASLQEIQVVFAIKFRRSFPEATNEGD
jgi:hypothetical protein